MWKSTRSVTKAWSSLCLNAECIIGGHYLLNIMSFFLWCWGLTPGLHICQASALPLVLYPQSFRLYFVFEIVSCYHCWGWLLPPEELGLQVCTTMPRLNIRFCIHQKKDHSCSVFLFICMCYISYQIINTPRTPDYIFAFFKVFGRVPNSESYLKYGKFYVSPFLSKITISQLYALTGGDG
jgi:hypothetical protein